jgi:hypothetical protein
VTLTKIRIADTTNLSAVFSQLSSDGAHAIFCSGGILSRPVVRQIVMSYAYRSAEMFRAAATYVDKILKGEHPGNLPLTVWRHLSRVGSVASRNLKAATA